MNFNKNPDQRQATQTVFMQSIIGLANLVAIIAAFLGTPELYGRTIGWIQSYTSSNYGAGLEDIVSFTWFVICACLIFFLARTTVSTALIMGGLAVVTRLM